MLWKKSFNEETLPTPNNFSNKFNTDWSNKKYIHVFSFMSERSHFNKINIRCIEMPSHEPHRYQLNLFKKFLSYRSKEFEYSYSSASEFEGPWSLQRWWRHNFARKLRRSLWLRSKVFQLICHPPSSSTRPRRHLSIRMQTFLFVNETYCVFSMEHCLSYCLAAFTKVINATMTRSDFRNTKVFCIALFMVIVR